MKKALFILWFLATCSDAIIAFVAGLRVRQRPGRYAAILSQALFCVAFEAIVAAGSLLLFYQSESDITSLFAVSRTVGRAVKCVGIWRLALWLLNLINGDTPQQQTEVAKMSGALAPEVWIAQFEALGNRIEALNLKFDEINRWIRGQLEARESGP